MFLIAFLIFVFPDFKDKYRLAVFGTAVDGTVLAVSCSGRRPFITFEFVAVDRLIVGKGETGIGNPSCWALKKGDKVKLSYLPEEPSTNGLGNAKENLRRDLIFWGFLLPSLTALIYFTQAFRRSTNSTEQI
jgi:hypothetical protein